MKLKSLFPIAALCLLAASCTTTPGEFEKTITIDPQDLQLKDGVCRIAFSAPDAWKQAEEYDRVCIEFGRPKGADELIFNGKMIGRRGFIPEDGEESLPGSDGIARYWTEKHYYVSTDDLEKDNVIEIRTNARTLDSPLVIGLVHRTRDKDLMRPMQRYTEMVRELEQGWHSWDTRSVFTQLYLPETFSVKMALMDGDKVRDDLRIGNRQGDAAVLRPSAHTYDGRYSECDATWHGISVKLRTSSAGDDLIMLATPLEGNDGKGRIRISPEDCWPHFSGTAPRNNYVLKDDRFYIYRNDWAVGLKGGITAPDLKLEGGYYTCSTDGPILVTVGPTMSPEEADKYLADIKAEIETEEKAKYGEGYDAYHAMQTILAWDTVYDPGEEIVVSPVTRNWNVQRGTVSGFGGYVLYDWDTYFATQMLSVSCKELAYSNAVELTSCGDKLGFIPKSRSDHNSMTEDCSQPPVGSMSIWKIYERWGDKWFLELVYDALLDWNRWWPEARQTDGLLCWGSTPVRLHGGEGANGSRNNAGLESGLDNTPMHDGVTYNPVTLQLDQQDVGLTSMYVMDCDYLIKIAKELGHRKDAREIAARAEKFRKAIGRFWCEEDGIFYNINTQTGEFNKRISPTNFYPLLAKAATQEQARRMIGEHMLNEEEFWGEWVIPMTPKNDPAFKDQAYWRGRIWGPTNYLVYAGLCNYDLPEVRREFAQKSNALFMKGWLSRGYIYENYNAIVGDGGDRNNCDAFYHWGALLGYIYLLDTKIVNP